MRLHTLLPLLLLTACAPGPVDEGAADAGGTGGTAGDAGVACPAVPEEVAWPNAQSSATSDPWLAANHDRLTVLRPRVMALNYVNARPMADMRAKVEGVFAAMREGSRDHGYADACVKPFLEPQLAYAVDLRDPNPPPAGYAYRNSTRYPRESPPSGSWGFDYGFLFTQDFADQVADQVGVKDPSGSGRNLTLCELSERGLVHEVWVYGDADVPDVTAAEVLTLTPRHDARGVRVPGAPLDRCAGNGCFDADDAIPAACQRTLRIAWLNQSRGPGCFLESLSHGIESLGNGPRILPPFARDFMPFAFFDMDARFGTPFSSWYACPYDGECLSYPAEKTVRYTVQGTTAQLSPYVPACGSAHFPPNARRHYDVGNPASVPSTCKRWRQGEGGASPEDAVSAADWARYGTLAPDCTGPFLVWWWQNFPGPRRLARDPTSGAPMKNWWPYLYY
jgi:hypothetical protein